SAANLRQRSAPSLEYVEEPSQYTASGPDFSRIAVSLAPISSIAWSQLTRVHWPLTSFIGYFRRRSPCTSSRTAAPLAQCEPRLIGQSQPRPWPIRTPFATSATTVQPTEQCVQMFLRMVTCAPAGGGGPASALRTLASGNAPTVARPPATRPERRRKARRSSAPSDGPCRALASVPRRARRSVLLISTAASLSSDTACLVTKLAPPPAPPA